MDNTAQFTYDCLWRVDGEKRVCTGGHESDGYPCYIINIRWCNILLKTNGKCKMHKMYMCSNNYYDRLFLSLLVNIIFFSIVK